MSAADCHWAFKNFKVYLRGEIITSWITSNESSNIFLIQNSTSKEGLSMKECALEAIEKLQHRFRPDAVDSNPSGSINTLSLDQRNLAYGGCCS